MKEFLRKNIILVLAFSLPIVLIAVVAVSAYVPSLFVSTKYNFVYASCAEGAYYYEYNCDAYLQKKYTIVNGALTVNAVDQVVDKNANGTADYGGNYLERLFLHDTQTNTSREITLEEAQKLPLSSLLTSPDGLTVSSHYNSGGGDFFLFYNSRSSFGYYLTKGNARKKMNVINSNNDYYSRNFHFVGWITPPTGN